MRTAKRAIRRLALVGWLGLARSAGLVGDIRARPPTPPERVLPDSTVFFLKVNDVKALREAFRQSQYGQLWNDPALKDFRDDLVAEARGRQQDAQGEDRRHPHGAARAAPGGRRRSRSLARDDPKLPDRRRDHRRRRQERRRR